MADPDVVDLGTIYNVRERERTHTEFEAVFGPVAVDTSEAGLERNAQAAEGMGGRGRISGPLESSSETVRAKASAEQATAEQTPLAAEALARLFGYKDAAEARERLSKGDLTLGGALRFADPVGNIGEALGREQATRLGLPPDLAEKIALGGGLASILFPMPGKASKVGGGMKAGEQAIEGVNPSRLGTMAEDVATTIKNIGAFNAERMERGVVTHAQTIRAAEAAMSLEDALKFDPAKYDLATLRTAVAGHFAAASTYYTDVAKRVASGDTQAVSEYWTAFTVMSDLAAKDALLGTQLGRGLEASKITLDTLRAPFGPQDVQQIAQLLAGAPEAGMDAATHARRMLMLNRTQQKTVASQTIGLLKNGQNALYELWINSLLSGPQTHATNISSNSLTAAWAPGERMLSAILDFGSDRSVFFGEGPAMMYGAVEGFKDGIRMAAKVIREGSAGSEKIEHAATITAEGFGLNPQGVLGSAVDLVGAFVRTPGRALMTEDAFFKGVNYRMELRALAYREAAQEGLSGRAFADRVRYITTHADEFPDVKNRADQFALMQTFNKTLEDLGNIGQMGKGVQAFAEGAPLGRIVVPFIKTPTNIMHYASERTPVLNLLADTWRADFLAGGERRALALGKLAGGSMVTAVIASYAGTYIDTENPTAYMTVITGAGPKNQAGRATLERQGWKPFSIWNPIAGEYTAYNRLDPLGMTFGIIASTTEIIGQIPETGAAELTMAAVQATAKSLISKTYMEGLSNFLDAMEGNPGDIAKFFQGLARSGVPAVVRQTTRTLDPIKREADTLFDHWRAGLPGYDGPPSPNLWGDPQVYSGGLGPDIASPVYTSAYKADAVDRYLQNNRIFLPKTPTAVAGAPPPGLQMEPETGREGIRLTVEERARLGVLIGKGGDAPTRTGDLGVLSGTPPLKDVIAEIIAGPGTDGPTGSRADMIRAAVNLRRRMAIQQLREESPELDAGMTQKLEQRIQSKMPAFGPGLQILPGGAR